MQENTTFAMSGRSGPPVKSIFYGLIFISFIYILYIYTSTTGKLRDAQNKAERYRREEETKVSQLQDVLKAKDDLQDRCESERQEFVQRINSLNQQQKMLKGRNEEMEAENGRLQQELQKLKDDQSHIESQRSQEFQQLKQEKELEIASIKDQVANFQRQNEQLQNEISSLKTQLQNSQQQHQQDSTQLEVLRQELNQVKSSNVAAVNQQQVQQGNQPIQLQQQQAVAQQAVAQQQLGNAQQPIVDQQAQQPNQPVVGIDGVKDVANPVDQQQQQQQQADFQPVDHGDQQQANDGNGILDDAKKQVLNIDHQVGQIGDQLANLQAGAAQRDGNVAVKDTKNGAEDAQHQVQPPPDVDAPALGAGDDKDSQNGEGKNELVEHNGQIFKPDFKINEDLLKENAADVNIKTLHDIDTKLHDNRLKHEGPVGLQVQEPKLSLNDENNAAEDNHDADSNNNQVNQMDIPNFDRSNKDLNLQEKVKIENEDEDGKNYNEDYKYDDKDINEEEEEEQEEGKQY